MDKGQIDKLSGSDSINSLLSWLVLDEGQPGAILPGPDVAALPPARLQIAGFPEAVREEIKASEVASQNWDQLEMNKQ